jgi:uncharacterized protein YggE
MPAASAATTGQQVVDAVEKVLGRSQSRGVVFFADCAGTAAALQRQAFQSADAKARQLADSTSQRLTSVASVTQTGRSPAVPFASAVDPCDASSIAADERLELQPVDAKPEVKVTVQLAVTWAIAGAPAPATPRANLQAVGKGSEAATADEAYVVVVFSSDDEEDAEPLARKDRDELEKAVTALGFAKKDVEIVTANQYGPVTVLQVELKVGDVTTRGDDIVRAAEKVLGRSDASGVRFGLSSCDQALGRARKEAVGDAKARATALAEAAGVRLGDVQAVSELAATTGIDPCDDGPETLFASDDYGDAIQAFDAKPEFRVKTSVRLSYGTTT